jgi:hypothetical protein
MMKQNLFTVILILICLALVFVLVLGVRYLVLSFLLKAMGPRDWSVPLPGGYEIQRINSQSIVLAEPSPDGHSEIVIHSYINAYWYDQRYIGLWCAAGGADDLLGAAPEADSFYLVDSLENTVHGPLDPDAYEELCLQLQLSAFDQWTKTAPQVPSDAVF